MFLNYSNFVMTIIGDSIEQGCRIKNVEDSYVSIIRRRLFKQLLEHDEFETVANFGDSNNNLKFDVSGNYSFGSNGPLKTSLILKPDSRILLKERVGFIGIYYHSLNKGGMVRIIRDKNIVRDILLDTAPDGNFTVLLKNDECIEGEYELVFIDVHIEVMGIVVLQNPSKNIIFNRFAVSGYSSEDFVSENVISSIYTMGTLLNSPGVFLLGIGTNDIYSLSKSVYSEEYERNIIKIIENLVKAENNHIIITIPPQADESKYRILKSPYEKYRECLYKLSSKFQTELIDYSTIDFVANELYIDGVHPNEKGHLFIADFICDKLCIQY